MYNLSRLKTVAAVATFLVASAISTTAASANPFNPFEALFGPQREPVTAPAYANPQDDANELRGDLRRQIVNYRTVRRPAPSSSTRRTPISIWCCPAARRCVTASAWAAKASPGRA
jgi:hypothetical protein